MRSRGGEKGPEEVEVKLPCADLEAVREKLRQGGAERTAPLHEEINDLYDDPEEKLSGRGGTLRLRRARGEGVLTYKGVARFEQGLKRRPEREVRVSDAETAHAILEGIGMQRRFRYEKRREEWEIEGCSVALDETPIGRFVEVEGNPVDIRRVVAALGLDFAEAIPYSYPKLYALRRRENPKLPPDMVFPAPQG